VIAALDIHGHRDFGIKFFAHFGLWLEQ
jgi:hypothetical protein